MRPQGCLGGLQRRHRQGHRAVTTRLKGSGEKPPCIAHRAYVIRPLLSYHKAQPEDPTPHPLCLVLGAHTSQNAWTAQNPVCLLTMLICTCRLSSSLHSARSCCSSCTRVALQGFDAEQNVKVCSAGCLLRRPRCSAPATHSQEDKANREQAILHVPGRAATCFFNTTPE